MPLSEGESISGSSKVSSVPVVANEPAAINFGDSASCRREADRQSCASVNPPRGLLIARVVARRQLSKRLCGLFFPSGGDRSARSRSSRRGSRGFRWRHIWQDESEPDSIPEATTRVRSYDFFARRAVARRRVGSFARWLCNAPSQSSLRTIRSAGSRHQFVALESRGNQQDLVILAFSGGGTRAAAFSYGVLEALRAHRNCYQHGPQVRLLDEVDMITGVSGGSFTALAYGLYGEKLFDDYEARFLKRNVQGELTARLLDPLNWGALSSIWLGAFRAGGATIRRNSIQRGHVRRPLSRGWADDRRERDGPCDRFSCDLRAAKFQCHVRGPRPDQTLARRSGIVSGAGRAVADNDQQLRRQLRLPRTGLASAVC